MTVVLILAKLIENYLDYKMGCCQETNLALIGHLEGELSKANLNLRTALDLTGDREVENGRRHLLRVQDEVDGLRRRMQSQELGGRRTFGNEQSVLRSQVLQDLMEVDRELYQQVTTFVGSTIEMRDTLTEDPTVDLVPPIAGMKGRLQVINEGLGKRANTLRGIDHG